VKVLPLTRDTEDPAIAAVSHPPVRDVDRSSLAMISKIIHLLQGFSILTDMAQCVAVRQQLNFL